MTPNRYNNMRDEQIIALIEDCIQSGLSSQQDICEHLAEMARRRIRHRLHTHPLYKWYQEVADGKLLMGVVALYHGKRDKPYLNRLVGRSLDMQKAILAERDIDVAQLDRKTQKIVDVRKPVIRLSLADFQRVFPLGKPPATLKEQREALEAELASRPVTRTTHGPIVKADATLGILKVGNTSVPFSAIRAALAEIGMTIQEN